ncbi:MAG: NAD(P)-binding protein [Dehalococcoidia bacterium]|nr:NAD(P)-binding protein [Dehalococcoidia bacterium]
MPPMLITLVGAGVSGLTTAILLQEHGHRIRR